MKKSFIVVLFSLFAIAGGSKSFAQTCTVTADPVSFGIVNLVSGTAIDTTANVRISCNGTPNTKIRVCSSLGSGTGGTTIGNPRFMLNVGGNKLNYSLYTTATLTNIWGSFVWPFVGSYPGVKSVINLPASGTQSITLTMYARILAGQSSTLSGLYTSDFTGHTRFDYDYNYLAACSTPATATTVAPFLVSATANADCVISATDMDFGTAGSLTSNIDASSIITARCTNLAPYSIALNNGVIGTSPTNRKMTQGANSVTYGLYRDAARSLAWGTTTGVDVVSGTGTGNNQSITVYGRVPPQTMPPANTYTDTINVVITY